jgi:DNA-binding NarL/FixJ family response regulator
MGMRPSYLLAPSIRPIWSDEHRRLLIVDDDPFFRSLLKVMLAQTGLPIAEIWEAEESRTAVALCREQPIDLVFCDLNLPAMWSKNGIGTMHDIRRVRPDLPVYMCTAEDTSDIIAEVLSAGAKGHLLKPVNLRILKRVLTETFSPGVCASPDGA